MKRRKGKDTVKAIRVRYLGATDYKGARLVADDGDGNRVTIGYPYDLDGEQKPLAAAEALCKKMGWSTDIVGGQHGQAWYFCFVGGA
jgi:hypothetical protein